ncbi:MAG: dihydroorotate dehydrogenase electron transfer subunit [Desulfotomaculaceae bacterium]|nr:dihydroorotate dehydrogenase electron transfer subunit [Desulfotomaculaceae bacterium]
MSLVIDAKVVQNKQIIPGHYRITLATPYCTEKARPGQFLHVRCGSTQDPLLRRPISIHAVDPQAGEVSLLYRVAGRGTALLAEYRVGDMVSIFGPLGRGFTLPKGDGKVCVVSGGIGIAPLYFLLQKLAGLGIFATVFQGVATAKQILIEDEIRELGHSVVVATDDGTKGFHGTVTSLFEDFLRGGGLVSKPGINEDGLVSCIFTCGPPAMMKRLSEIAAQQGAYCEVSLEERMGCGVGACLSCACKIKDGSGWFHYRRACVEGPVFPAGEVFWE